MNKCVIQKASFAQYLVAGALGGVVGGVVFGTMMGMMGMLTVIASMLGSSSAAVGFGIHMMISVLFGLGGGALLYKVPTCPGKTLFFALAYGGLLWVVGPLLVMPLMMNMPLFMINETSLMSLMGHMVYAVVLVIVARIYLLKCTNSKQ